MDKKLVNVDELLRTKAAKFYKFIPRFLINYIKRTIHEDDLNRILEDYKDLKGIAFAKAALDDMGVQVLAEGLENIPKEGGIIFAANHPLGGLDGMAVIISIGKVRSDIKYFVNELLLAIKPLDNILVPVNINGNSTRQMLELVEQVFRSDYAIPIFPAGLVSRRQPDKSIKDLRWKKSFITQAKHFKKDIIPIWVEGRNSNFFYRFAMWRKKLGIKVNIEMFFLPNEMFAQKNKRIVVHFGKPVSFTTFMESRNDAQWATKFQDALYQKKELVVKEELFTPAAKI
ncbi:MAG TPA: 1-acyl-sn-glycerol-3-phosphate acyltransferase [Bacteroidia bacterium]|nr:1-acyl-sn-glycerol-3-phosphate acyltransferase [Bacteroidia bacterium]